jgi:hypothetical protein
MKFTNLHWGVAALVMLVAFVAANYVTYKYVLPQPGE